MSSWVVEMQALLDNLGNDQSQGQQQPRRVQTSIYKVHPAFISNTNKTAYQPQMVSFGPYHHGEPQLASMEDQKRRILLYYIQQAGRTVQEVFNLVAEMAQDLKDSYDSLDSKWQDDTEGFVQLMILDGCFMLELLGPFYTNHSKYYRSYDQDMRLGLDVLMLENQLPMFFLIKIKCILRHKDKPNIEEVKELEELKRDILRLFDLHYSRKDVETTTCLHVLDLCRKSLLHAHSEHGNASPQVSNQGKGKGKRVSHNVAHLVSTFHDAGIRIMKSEGESLQDITFERGILKIPNFIVEEYTETMVLNLLAFEGCHIPAGYEITSFVAFMGCIIDDGRDITLLSSKGIINNYIGADKEVADLFNTMSKDLVMGKDLYKVYTDLIDHCNLPWPKWRANLIQTYFRSPWAIVSIIAATFGLSLATVQTIFTILN